MSDYLWDRSGEADAEVERLEELLGRLRYAPRPFELPAETVESAQRAARASRLIRASRSSPARLAIAATLLVAVLAGALALLRRAPGVVRGNESASATQSAPALSPVQAPTATHEGVQRTEQRESVASRATAKPSTRAFVSHVAATVTRRHELFEARVAPASDASGGAFDMESRVRAKEQLVEAMRLTSEAFREVRSRASGADSFDASGRAK
jgi:hypothetical protein